MKKINLLIIAIVVLATLNLTGCAPALTSALENTELTVDAQMAQSVFLSPNQLAKSPIIYVRVTNTAGYEGDLTIGLKDSIREIGYVVTDDPEKADYLVMANLLHMGDAVQRDPYSFLKTMAGNAALGSSIAALANAKSSHVFAYGGITGAATGLINYGASKMLKVKVFSGVIDIRIIEQGSGVEHKTRLTVTARQTNLKAADAFPLIGQELAQRTAALFG